MYPTEGDSQLKRAGASEGPGGRQERNHVGWARRSGRAPGRRCGRKHVQGSRARRTKTRLLCNDLVTRCPNGHVTPSWGLSVGEGPPRRGNRRPPHLVTGSYDELWPKQTFLCLAHHCTLFASRLESVWERPCRPTLSRWPIAGWRDRFQNGGSGESQLGLGDGAKSRGGNPNRGGARSGLRSRGGRRTCPSHPGRLPGVACGPTRCLRTRGRDRSSLWIGRIHTQGAGEASAWERRRMAPATVFRRVHAIPSAAVHDAHSHRLGAHGALLSEVGT